MGGKRGGKKGGRMVVLCNLRAGKYGEGEGLNTVHFKGWKVNRTCVILHALLRGSRGLVLEEW